MKKWCVLLLVLLVVMLLPICAMAGRVETKCSDHPNAAIVEKVLVNPLHEQYSNIYHHTHLSYNYCFVCGKLLTITYRAEEREFNGNTCRKCGYTKPSKSTLNEQALVKIAEGAMNNKQCTVMYQCKVYDQANGNYKNYMLDWPEICWIKEYKKVGAQAGVLLKKTSEPNAPEIGWVAAEYVEVDNREKGLDPEDWIGRTVRITTTSGRARTRPSQDAPIKEYVHVTEKYVVLDATVGTNGTVWLQIKVSGNEVWISSGLARMD